MAFHTQELRNGLHFSTQTLHKIPPYPKSNVTNRHTIQSLPLALSQWQFIIIPTMKKNNKKVSIFAYAFVDMEFKIVRQCKTWPVKHIP